MNLSELFYNIQWIPVLIMTIVSFVLGFVYHMPFLFGKVWKQLNNYDSNKKINAPLIFGGSAILHFIAFAAMSSLTAGMGMFDGLLFGLFVSFFWVLPSMGGTYLFANRSVKLLAIDAGLYILLYAFAGSVFGFL